jgi:hypothetical protein
MHLEKELSFQQPQITFLVLGSPPPHTHTLWSAVCAPGLSGSGDGPPLPGGPGGWGTSLKIQKMVSGPLLN